MNFLACIKGSGRGALMRFIAAMTLVSAFLGMCPRALAVGSQAPPRTQLGKAALRVSWVDVRGRILQQVKAKKAYWVWKKDESGKIRGAALRVQTITP